MGRRLATRLVLMGMLVGLLAGAAGSVAADQNYACVDKSCTFTVPDSYSIASNDASQIIFSDSVSGGAFSVATQDASNLNSLDDAVKSFATAAAASDGYQAGPDNGKNIVLAGNPATLVEYVANTNGAPIEYAIFVTLYQGKAYQLIFATKPENEDAFVAGAQGVFSSWLFT